MKRVPLALSPWMKPVVWGSDVLQRRFGKAFDPRARLGETWEASDVPDHESRVLPEGRLLSHLVAEDPTAFANAEGRFPLLVKLLAPKKWLSIQVHPNDAQAARETPPQKGKHEAWFILEAAPEAEILLGLAEDRDARDFDAAIEEGSEAAFRRVLRSVRVRAGDVIDVPPGTVHALGPRVTLVEVQQPSDLTYRIYDWGRDDRKGQSRPLHLPQARAVLDPSSRPELRPSRALGPGDHALLTNPHFRLRRVRAEGRCDLELDELAVVVGIAGRGTLSGGGALPLELRPGRSCLVPRGLDSVRLDGPELEVLVALPPRPPSG